MFPFHNTDIMKALNSARATARQRKLSPGEEA